MPKLTPVNWQTLVKVFEVVGFVYQRTKGSHVILVREGTIRPVVIPKYDELGPDIIKSNLRTAGISREEYFEILKDVR